MYFDSFYFCQCELLTDGISIQAKDVLDTILETAFTLRQKGDFFFLHRRKLHLQDEPDKPINTANERNRISFRLQHLSLHYYITGECTDPCCSSQRDFSSSTNKTFVSMSGGHRSLCWTYFATSFRRYTIVVRNNWDELESY